jgi:hypothetical protein
MCRRVRLNCHSAQQEIVASHSRIPILTAMRRSPRLKRYRFLGGPYSAPACRVGRKLYCRWRRRWVKVDGLTDAPVMWPFTQRCGPRSLILCGDLVRAVRDESVAAVAAHWGVARETVWRWRQALGVPEYTRGTPAHPRHDPGEDRPRQVG